VRLRPAISTYNRITTKTRTTTRISVTVSIHLRERNALVANLQTEFDDIVKRTTHRQQDLLVRATLVFAAFTGDVRDDIALSTLRIQLQLVLPKALSSSTLFS
jgi:hypothetical protein